MNLARVWVGKGRGSGGRRTDSSRQCAWLESRRDGGRGGRAWESAAEVRNMAWRAAKCRDPQLRKSLRKVARKARMEILPVAKQHVVRPIKKLWIEERVCEDRETWKNVLRPHCDKCYDHKRETSEAQEEWVMRNRERVLREDTEGRKR